MKFTSVFLIVATTASILSSRLINETEDRFALSLWWTVLCTISVLNVCLWYTTAMTVLPQKSKFRTRQLLLSFTYVFGCAFRSILPRADIQRICLIDSWFSTVLVGRTVATVAELAFAAQWAIVLNSISVEMKSWFGVVISMSVFPLIFFAEICSWYAVFTTCYIGNVIEESTWALVCVLLVICFLRFLFKCEKKRRKFEKIYQNLYDINVGLLHFHVYCGCANVLIPLVC